RGYRIEPGEVEAVLASHPAVAQAVVVAREQAAGQQQLVGYFVPSQSSVNKQFKRERAAHEKNILDGESSTDRNVRDAAAPYSGDLVQTETAREVVAELRQYVAHKLPSYMVPVDLIPLERLPLNANGKLERSALRNYSFKSDEECAPPKG